MKGYASGIYFKISAWFNSKWVANQRLNKLCLSWQISAQSFLSFYICGGPLHIKQDHLINPPFMYHIRNSLPPDSFRELY
jgi:hypothetical protein